MASLASLQAKKSCPDPLKQWPSVFVWFPSPKRSPKNLRPSWCLVLAHGAVRHAGEFFVLSCFSLLHKQTPLHNRRDLVLGDLTHTSGSLSRPVPFLFFGGASTPTAGSGGGAHRALVDVLGPHLALAENPGREGEVGRPDQNPKPRYSVSRTPSPRKQKHTKARSLVSFLRESRPKPEEEKTWLSSGIPNSGSFPKPGRVIPYLSLEWFGGVPGR